MTTVLIVSLIALVFTSFVAYATYIDERYGLAVLNAFFVGINFRGIINILYAFN